MAIRKKPAKSTPSRKPAVTRRKAAPRKEGSGQALLVGAGIGSAAIAAAVLFMTRRKKPGAKAE